MRGKCLAPITKEWIRKNAGSAWHARFRENGVFGIDKRKKAKSAWHEKRKVPGTNCLAARRHRRATPNARSGSKPAGPSVDGQGVRRTKKRRAISIWPLDSQSPVRTSINLWYDGHLVRREYVDELSNPPPPASNTQKSEKCLARKARSAWHKLPLRHADGPCHLKSLGRPAATWWRRFEWVASRSDLA